MLTKEAETQAIIDHSARQLTELHDALLTNHGAPLREERYAVPPSHRWVAVARNRLFADRPLPTFYGTSYEAARAESRAAGVDRADMFIVCERCAKRLAVKNVTSAEKILRTHQTTEVCLYRSTVCVLLWAGFVPLAHVQNQYAPEVHAALRTVKGPSTNRTVTATWAPLPRVLSVLQSRISRHLERHPDRAKMAAGPLAFDAEKARRLDVEDAERAEHADLDPWFMTAAMEWSAELLAYSDRWENTGDVHAFFAERIAERLRAP